MTSHAEGENDSKGHYGSPGLCGCASCQSITAPHAASIIMAPTDHLTTIHDMDGAAMTLVKFRCLARCNPGSHRYPYHIRLPDGRWIVPVHVHVTYGDLPNTMLANSAHVMITLWYLPVSHTPPRYPVPKLKVRAVVTEGRILCGLEGGGGYLANLATCACVT